MEALKVLFFPLAVLFHLVSALRNYAFDRGWLKSRRFEKPVVIGVGNLAVGGTGKTPAVEYLVRALLPVYPPFRVAVLSRGYGRATRGYRLVSGLDSAREVGDEPLQIFQKFGAHIRVAVSEKRVKGVEALLQEDVAPAVVLLDDAFQHRYIRPQRLVLLTDYAHPFFSDWLLPMGRLREARAGAARASAIVVTKCPPQLTQDGQDHVRHMISSYAPGVPVFFSCLHYGAVQPFRAGTKVPRQWILVSGLAAPTAFEQHGRELGTVIRVFRFPDHHQYTREDIRTLQAAAQEAEGAGILTTEKDQVKLQDVALDAVRQDGLWFVVPVEMRFLKDGSDFDNIVLGVIK